MRAVIQDKVSHNFIEGPVPSSFMNGNGQERVNDKTAFNTVLTNGAEVQGDATDIDIPYYSVNEKGE